MSFLTKAVLFMFLKFWSVLNIDQLQNIYQNLTNYQSFQTSDKHFFKNTFSKQIFWLKVAVIVLARLSAPYRQILEQKSYFSSNDVKQKQFHKH
jgi:hypothetical protein